MQQRNLALCLGAIMMVVTTDPAAMAGDPVGACCYCDGCATVTEAECGSVGGEYQGDGSGCTALCTGEVNMPDPNLRAAVQEALGGCALTEFNMLGLTELYASDVGITDLTGLEYAVNLTTFELEENLIDDLSPLAELTTLTWLDLSGNQITDISPLAGMRNLEILSLHGNEISSISPLEGLTNLMQLGLSANQITELLPLAGLRNLGILWLGGNEISSISHLEGLTNLLFLSLGENLITDVSPLTELTNLERLWLEHNQITEIPSLAGMTKLTYLNLSHNAIDNIFPLAGMTNMTELYLEHNEISNISPLAGMTNLTYLNLSYNATKNISHLAGLTNLTRVWLEHNQISTISWPAGMTNLTELDLGYNLIMDISALGTMTNLDRLVLRHNRIADISPLAGLTNLTELFLSENQITVISALEWLTYLRVLLLDDNLIRDISPLAGLTNLEHLELEHNQISKIAGLATLTNLDVLWLWENEITDILPVAELTNLSVLYLGQNQISDISPVAGLTNLTQLWLGGNQITNIAPIAGLTELNILFLDDNQISDISPLVGLTTLDLLRLSDNPLSLAARCTDILAIQDNNPDADISYDDTPHGACCLIDNSCLENVSQALCESVPGNLSWSECATCADVGCDPSGFFTGGWGGRWFDPGNWGGGSLPDSGTNVFIPVEVVIDGPGAVAATVSLIGDGLITFADGTLTAQTVTIGPDTAILGTGTITADVINGGGIAPGADPEIGLPVGTLTIVGSYVQTSAGELYLELTGVAEFDRLDVSAGDVTLGGVLYAEILGVFQPAPPADTLLDVIPAAAQDGMFGAVYTTGLWPDKLLTVAYPGAGPAGTTSLRVVDLTEIIDFEPPLVFDLDDLPSDAVVANFDVDAEGFIDLAVSVPVLDSVFVLFNQGNDVDGTWLGFGSSTQVLVGDAPSGITAADFDLDGDPDLATSNAGDGTVTAIRNDGGSVFIVSDTITVGTEPSDITTGTFDGDAFPDLAVTNRTDGTVSAVIGAGDSTFAANPAFPVGNQPIAIETGEFDGGPGIDLIVVTPAIDPEDDGAVVVLAGGGDGTFLVGPGIAVGKDPLDVDPEDFDNDKDLDAVVVNRGSESATVLLNDGAGALVPVIELDTDGPPSSVAAFSMDQEPAADSDLAVAVHDEDLGRLVRIFRNDLEDGQLAFVQDQDQAVTLEPILVLSGDVDNDGLEDLITINDDSGAAPGGAANASVGVLLNQSHMIEPPCPGDGNGDGDVGFPDLLLVLGEWGPCPAQGDCLGDRTGDGLVDFADLLLVLSLWGPCPGS